MKKKVTALMSVWNSAQWLPWSLRGIYPYVDEIVVCEACWVQEEGYAAKTSPDGTAAIVQKFRAEEDRDGKVNFIRKGRCLNQPQARNFGLAAVSHDTDWVWQVDADEFYLPLQAEAVRDYLDTSGQSYPGSISLPAKCFYFDFNYYKIEWFLRIYRYFPELRFLRIASPNCRGESIRLGSEQYDSYMHYSYVGPEWTRIKACMGEDLGSNEYKRWWNEVFSKFDGTNLEELYAQNGGGIHVMGGGPLELYQGPHPDVLDDHPLRHWKWEKPVAASP
jgi:hypothetical protein